MDKSEAQAVLAKALGDYRKRAYGELLVLLRTPEVFEVTAESGAAYQLEVDATWDGEADGNLRVMGSIDDGGLSAFVPLTDDFIIAPDGSFVGE